MQRGHVEGLIRFYFESCLSSYKVSITKFSFVLTAYNISQHGKQWQTCAFNNMHTEPQESLEKRSQIPTILG